MGAQIEQTKGASKMSERQMTAAMQRELARIELDMQAMALADMQQCQWSDDGVCTSERTCDRQTTIVVHFTDNVYSDSEWDSYFCAEHAAEVLAEDGTLVSAEAVRELV